MDTPLGYAVMVQSVNKSNKVTGIRFEHADGSPAACQEGWAVLSRELDKKNREAIQRADYLRSQRNKISKQIGALMGQGKKDEAEAAKQQVKDMQDELADIEQKEVEYAEEIRKRMLVIPNIIDASVPIGKDDSENVELERFGEPVVPNFEIPYHTELMERFNGIDLDAARRPSVGKPCSVRSSRARSTASGDRSKPETAKPRRAGSRVFQERVQKSDCARVIYFPECPSRYGVVW